MAQTNLVKLKAIDCSLSVSSETVQPVHVVRDLGVLLDSQLTMKQHINNVTAVCLLPTTATATNSSTYWTRRYNPAGVGTIVTSWLDYCNSVLAALPQSTIEPLQVCRMLQQG